MLLARYVESVGAVLVPTEMGREMTPASFLVLQNSPNDPCPSSTCSEVSKETTFSYTPGRFQTAVCMLLELFVVLCLEDGDSISCCPLVLPVLSLLIFKI